MKHLSCFQLGWDQRKPGGEPELLAVPSGREHTIRGDYVDGGSEGSLLHSRHGDIHRGLLASCNSHPIPLITRRHSFPQVSMKADGGREKLIKETQKMARNILNFVKSINAFILKQYISIGLTCIGNICTKF